MTGDTAHAGMLAAPDSGVWHSRRVHTMALPVKDALGQVFRGIDLEAQLCILAVNLAAKVRPCSLPVAVMLTCTQPAPEARP